MGLVGEVLMGPGLVGLGLGLVGLVGPMLVGLVLVLVGLVGPVLVMLALVVLVVLVVHVDLGGLLPEPGKEQPGYGQQLPSVVGVEQVHEP